MKLKELFKMVEYDNKFNSFTKRGGVEIVKIDNREFKDVEFESAKQLVKAINESYYTEINENIELVYEDEYIKMTFEQKIPEWRNGHFEYKKENMTINLYLDDKE